jgi:hypothetical protein
MSIYLSPAKCVATNNRSKKTRKEKRRSTLDRSDLLIETSLFEHFEAEFGSSFGRIVPRSPTIRELHGEKHVYED